MLLDSEQFADSSPFKMSHPVNYNLPNTTSDLLKFQLQQHHKLERLEKNKALDDGVNSVGQESGPLSGSDGSVGVSGGGSGAHPILHSSNVLNGYLQASIDTGDLAFDPETSLPGLSDSPSFDESTSSSDTEVSSSHMNTTNDTTINHSTKVPLKGDDVSIEAFIAQASSKPNYLNFKVLMENAIFDVSNINRSSILPFHLVKSLKSLIEDKKELKEYLISKINISHEFINDMILHPSNSSSSSSSSSIPFHEPGLLTKVIKANYKLQTELTKVDQELETLVNKLNNHNLACLLLGYMEDINLSSASHSGSISMDERGHSNIYDGGLTSAQSYESFDENSSSVPVNNFSDESPIKSSTITLTTGNTRTITTQPSAGTTPTTASNLYFGSPLRRHQQQQLQKQQNDRSVDNLLSYIASVAAQHSFTLPSPPKGADSTLPQSLEWAQQCFEAILTQQAQTQAQTQAKQLPTPPATAGNETNNKVISDLKTALNDLRFSHEYLTKEYEYERESSHKTIQEYRRKLISLERDLQKSKYSHNLTASNGLSGDSGKRSISTSASTSSLLGPSVELVVKDQEISRLRKELNQLKIEKIDNNSQPPSNLPSPSLNVVQSQSVEDLGSVRSNDGSLSPVGGQQLAGASLSSGILRKEFRKIVSDMQDQYELELSQERLLRRQLQEELDKR